MLRRGVRSVVGGLAYQGASYVLRAEDLLELGLGGVFSQRVDLLSQLPSDGNHDVSRKRRPPEARPADCHPQFRTDDKKLCDRTADAVSLDEIERIVI